MPIAFQVILFIYIVITFMVWFVGSVVYYEDNGGWLHEIMGYSLALAAMWPIMLLKSIFKQGSKIWRR